MGQSVPGRRRQLQLGKEASPPRLGVAHALLSHPEMAYPCLSPEDLAGNQKAASSSSSRLWESAFWSKGQGRE